MFLPSVAIVFRPGAMGPPKAPPQDGCGAIAQLGERRTGSAKVRGSSPLSSTIHPPVLHSVDG